MAFLGFGQITDPMDPKVQQPIPPPWMGRGSPDDIRLQQLTQDSLVALKALQMGGAAGEGFQMAMDAIAVSPDLSAEDRATLAYARSWIYTMGTHHIQALNRTLPTSVIEEARRRLWVPGVDPTVVHKQTIKRFQRELPTLEAWAKEVNAMLDELARYMDYTIGTFKQFEVYMAWMQHHLRKKEHRTQNVVKVLTVIGEVARWIPVVGWIVYAALVIAQVAVQVNNARNAAEELNRAGFRGYILSGAANIYESTVQTMATADNLYGQLQAAIAIREDYLKHAKAFIPPAVPGGVRQERAAKRAGGLLVGGGLAAAAVAALALLRR
jgi:hypothetical protein